MSHVTLSHHRINHPITEEIVRSAFPAADSVIYKGRHSSSQAMPWLGYNTVEAAEAFSLLPYVT
eukprot:966957-Prorocentrum_lima.AAC.1